MNAYSLSEAARILALPPARLRQWHRTALVPASAGHGAQPVFGFQDLVCIRAVVALLEHGVPMRRIRRHVEALRARIPELDRPIGSLRVWVEGSDRVVVRHGGALLEPDGQLVIDFRLGPEGEETPPEPLRGCVEIGGDLDLALEHFERGCQLDADPGRWAEAIDAYRAAVAADPAFSDAHCNLGTVHYNRGERELARICYQRALDHEPAHVEANFNLANLLEELGDDAGALRHYRLALAVEPASPDLHLNVALLEEKIGRLETALAHWRRYLKLAPRGNWAPVARQRLARERER